MLGTLDFTKPRACIIGGGISGLLIAYALAKRGWAIELHEASDRWGGLIQTGSTPQGTYETAAHSLLASEAVEALFEELNLNLMPLKNRQRYILRNGRLRRMPLSILEMIFLLFRFFFMRPPRNGTVEAWALKRLGAPALNYLVNPFLRGIYAARPSELSMQALFPNRARKRERQRPQMKAPEQGMESLVLGLVGALKNFPNVMLHLNSLHAVLPSYDGNVIIATPASVAANLLRIEFPELTAELEKIQYAPLITSTVFYQAEVVPPQIKGVGVLVPEIEADYRVLGVLFNSSSFEGRTRNENFASFTVMLGGTSHPEHLLLSESEISQIIDEDLKKILDVNVSPHSKTVTRWKSAIPLYNETLLRAWDSARKVLGKSHGIVLFGNYTGQVSIRGMIESLSTLPFDKVK